MIFHWVSAIAKANVTSLPKWVVSPPPPPFFSKIKNTVEFIMLQSHSKSWCPIIGLVEYKYSVFCILLITRPDRSKFCLKMPTSYSYGKLLSLSRSLSVNGTFLWYKWLMTKRNVKSFCSQHWRKSKTSRYELFNRLRIALNILGLHRILIVYILRYICLKNQKSRGISRLRMKSNICLAQTTRKKWSVENLRGKSKC